MSVVETAESPDASALRLGARIRRLRHARGMTLVQLAERAELSHPFLSQLERGLARPSMGSLEKIARGLGSSPLEMLAEAEPDPAGEVEAHVVRAGEGARGPFGEGDARMLAARGTRLRPIELVGDNPDFGEFFAHAEDEFVYVLSGGLEAEIEGEPAHLLAEGDALYIPGGAGHRWRAPDGTPYKVLIVKERPRRA